MSIVVALHEPRRWKRGHRHRARTNRTNNGRGESRPIRGNGLSRSTQSLSRCRSCTSQGGWLSLPVLSCPLSVNARIPRLLKWRSKESIQEVGAWVLGSVRHGNAIEQHTWALSVLIRTLLPEGMACWRANVQASCLLLHVLVACTLVELHQAFRRRKPWRWACRVARVPSVVWFRLIQDLYTSLVVHLRGTCSGLGRAFPRKRSLLARHLSVILTLQVWSRV